MAVSAPDARSSSDYDPYSTETVADPYKTYSTLLAGDGVYYNQRLGFYALTRYADIIEYGRDWRTFSYSPAADIDNSGDALGPGNFLDQDPPVHTAMRGVVQKAFAPKVLRARLEHVIERETSALIATLVERGYGDFAAEVGWVLPMRLVAEQLGIPREDLPMLAAWEEDFVRRTLGQRNLPASAVEASGRLRDYFAELLIRRRKSPQDDLLSVIAQAPVDAESRDAIHASMALLLWAASVETTACLLTNSVVLLAAHPDQRTWLRSRPDAIPDAVEEILRFEAPLQVLRRTTTRDVEIRGTHIANGSIVFMVYGAANRDPRRFENANSLDVTRHQVRHLAFGDGIHHCLGAPLARLEAQIMLRILLEKSPGYAVGCDSLERLESYIVRGYTKVPLVMNSTG